MSFGEPAPEGVQPDHFEFTPENVERARQIIAKYPPGKQYSAVLPLLDLAQRQHGNWLPRAAMDHVAGFLEMPRIRVYEVASFYTMLNKAPVGRHLVQVCTTTPCWLCGSDDILRAIRDKTGTTPGHTSGDGEFTVMEVECLGACVNAPMVQVNDDYYEDLDYDRMCGIIDMLKRGEKPVVGSQVGRMGSQALGGPTSLLGERPGAKKKAAPAEEAAEPAAPIPAAKPAAAPQPEEPALSTSPIERRTPSAAAEEPAAEAEPARKRTRTRRTTGAKTGTKTGGTGKTTRSGKSSPAKKE